MDGTFKLFYKNQKLEYIPIEEYQSKKIINAKDKLVWNPSKGGNPDSAYPWKKYGYQIPLSNQIRKIERRV